MNKTIIISFLIACVIVFFIGRSNGLNNCKDASISAKDTISQVKTIYIKNTANITATDKRKKLMEWVK